jgi:hypothetical protein
MNILLLVLLALHPQQAQHLAATSSGHDVTLSWSQSVPGANCAAPAAITYSVLRGPSAGLESGVPLNPTPLTTTGFVDSTVVLGQTYYYVVMASEQCGTLNFSAPRSNEMSVQFPQPPTAAVLQALVAN